MSRRGAFVMTPVEHAKAWYKLRYWDRALGADLFRVFGNDEALDIGLDDLPDVVCRILAVDGRDRATVRRALTRIIEHGLIVEDGEATRLLYSTEAFRAYQRATRKASGNGQQSDGEPSGNGPQTTSESSVNAQQTDSEPTVTGQQSDRDQAVNGQEKRPKPAESNNTCIPYKKDKIDKKEYIEERDARAGDPEFWQLDGHESFAAWVNAELKRWKSEHDPCRMPPPQGEGWAKAVRALATTLESTPDPRGTLRKLLAGFEADEKAKANGYPVAWLATNPSQYVVAKPTKRNFAVAVPDESEAHVHDGSGDNIGDTSHIGDQDLQEFLHGTA